MARLPINTKFHWRQLCSSSVNAAFCWGSSPYEFITGPRHGATLSSPVKESHVRRGGVLVIFTRYAFALKPSPFLSITCAVMRSG